MKKPKGYSKIVVDNHVWFWKVGKKNIHARSESGQNLVALHENVPAEEVVLTEEFLLNADSCFCDEHWHQRGQTLRYFHPKHIATWIRSNR